MGRYFFHFHNGIEVPDLLGQDLPSFAAAHSHALAEVREMAVDAVRNGYLDLSYRVEVTDPHGNEIVTVSIADAIRLMPDGHLPRATDRE